MARTINVLFFFFTVDLARTTLPSLCYVLKFLSAVSPHDGRDSPIKQQAELALGSLRSQNIILETAPYFGPDFHSPIYDHIRRFKEMINETYAHYPKRAVIEQLEKSLDPSKLELSVGEVFEACGELWMA